MAPRSRPSNRHVDQVRLESPDTSVFDFRSISNFPRDYLATYYCQPPAADERAVLSFLVRHYPKITSQPCAIEIGCGPTVHHVLPLSPFVSEIHMADYLLDNLEQVRLWRDGAPDAHRWQRYTALTLALEERAVDDINVEERERELRRKMSRFVQCDLKRDSPLCAPRQYPVVCSFYCAENIGLTKHEWIRVMRRLADLTAPGGYLFLAALQETHFYLVKSADGSSHRFPSAFLTHEDFEEVLPHLGFCRQHTVVESTSLRGQEDEGVCGVILVAAQKT